MENRTVRERKQLVDPKVKTMSTRRQCEILQVNRSSLYYKPLGESEENLKLMGEMDKIFTADPTLGGFGHAG